MPKPAAAVRVPAVAGTFYPADADEMKKQAALLLPSAGTGGKALALVCPHAGWMYSGKLAGKLLASVAVPERVIVLAPNHTGMGVRGSVWAAGSWKLPGLSIPVDDQMTQKLCDESTLLQPDTGAHQDEHAIEVLLPLLATRQPNLRIAPVVLGPLGWAECETLGHVIARLCKGAGGDVLVVASSDMNHYKPDAETREIDKKALAPMQKLDAHGLYDAVRRHDISMCGYVPATVALVAANDLGAKEATLVGYATSADAGGDKNRVVGYAALAVR